MAESVSVCVCVRLCAPESSPTVWLVLCTRGLGWCVCVCDVLISGSLRCSFSQMSMICKLGAKALLEHLLVPGACSGWAAQVVKLHNMGTKFQSSELAGCRSLRGFIAGLRLGCGFTFICVRSSSDCFRSFLTSKELAFVRRSRSKWLLVRVLLVTGAGADCVLKVLSWWLAVLVSRYSQGLVRVLVSFGEVCLSLQSV